MHPVLVSLPLPGYAIPLSPALAVVAAVGVLVALVGWRAKAADLLAIGAAVALACAVAAALFRGKTYTLTQMPLSSYGLTLCLALVAGWFLTLGLARRDGLPREVMANCFIVTAISGFVFARLLYVLVNLHEFDSLASTLSVRRGGLIGYGGLIGGLVGSIAYLRARRMPLLPWADVAAPSAALGIAITRIGSYLLGSSFGRPLGQHAPTWLKRSGTFPHWPDDVLEGAGAPAWVQHVTDGLLPLDSAASLPVHPTQLYEAAGGLLLVGALYAVRQNQSFRGQVFLALAFAYGLLRFVVELFRGDPQRGLLGPYIAEHRYIPLVLLMFAAAYAFGPAHSISRTAVRRTTQLLFALAALPTFVLLRPDAFTLANSIQLSTAQWIALVTAISAAVAWGVWAKVAEANPEAAMSLDLPESDQPADEVGTDAQADGADTDTAPTSDGDGQ